MTYPRTDPSEIVASLVDLLDVQEIAPFGEFSTPATVAAYRAESSPQPGGHVFGGQVMGQAVKAVGRTVADDRRIHSMYSYFLAPGDPAHPIRFQVDALRDGGSFSVRRVLANQPADDADGGERTILAMTASFQKEQDGLEHSERAPEAPDPEGLPTTADVLAGIDHPTARYWATQRPIDIRHVTDPIYLLPDPSSAASGETDRADTQMVWMRTLAPVGSEPLLHDAILAFASDYTPFEPILRRQGLSWMTPGLKMATIDHAIWWHKHADANDWLLYVQRSPSASGGRGLTHGQVFDRAGDLVATVTQEGMIRAPRTG